MEYIPQYFIIVDVETLMIIKLRGREEQYEKEFL